MESVWAAFNWLISGVCLCMRYSGAVSLAGAQNNLWAVEGGNKLVCSGLLKIANANLLQAKVISISLMHSGTCQISKHLAQFLPF